MHRGTGLRQALEGLSMCGTGLTTELWYGHENTMSMWLFLYSNTVRTLNILILLNWQPINPPVYFAFQ